MGRRAARYDSEFYCTRCGERGIPVPRTGNARESGHLKRLTCVTCGADVNHVEVREDGRYTHADFRMEFAYGNFDGRGRRYLPWEKFVGWARTGRVRKGWRDDAERACELYGKTHMSLSDILAECGLAAELFKAYRERGGDVGA